MIKKLLLLTTIILTWAATVNAQNPVLTNTTPVENFINEQFCFEAVLTETSVTEGYNPIVHAIFPPEIEFNSVTFNGGGLNAASIQTYISTGAPVIDLILEDRIARDGDNPVTDAEINAPVGSTVVIIQLPVGSVVQNGVPLTVQYCATIRNAPTATVGVPVPVTVRPLYELGGSPEGDGIKFGSENTQFITPKLYELSKSNSAPRGERPPGPIWAMDYTVSVDIANGQTINDIVISDVLPNGLKLVPGSVNITGGLDVTYAPTTMNETLATTGTDGGTLQIGCGTPGCGVTGGVGGGDVIIEYQAYIIDILNKGTCEEDNLENHALVSSGTYGGNPLTPTTASANSTVTARHLTMQHSATTPVDAGEDGFQPDDFVDFTVNFQINEFSNSQLNEISVEVIIPDGMTFIAITDAVLAGEPLTTASFAAPQIGTPAIGQTTLDLDFGTVYKAETGNALIPDGGQTGTLTYRVQIDQQFEVPPMDDIVARETLSPGAFIAYELDEGGVCSNSDGASINISSVAIVKELLNGKSPGEAFVPGEQIIYKLTMDVVSGDAEEIFFEEFLPLPIFEVSEFNSYATSDAISLRTSTESLRYALDDESEGLLPIDDITVDVSRNYLKIDFGNLSNDAVSGEENIRISIIIAATVTDKPFDDALFHTNFLQAGTNQTATEAAASILILVGAPKLTITKGIVASDNPSAVIDPNTGFPQDGDITAGADADDQITFVLTIENEGLAPARQVKVTDAETASNLTNFNVVSIMDGTGADVSGYFTGPNVLGTSSDLFTGAGIVMNSNPTSVIAANDNSPITSAGGGGADVIYITYTADIVNNVEPTTITNNASVQWKNIHDDDATPDADYYSPDTDAATILIEAEISKTRSPLYSTLANWPSPLLPGDLSNTNDPNNFAEVGDFVVYTIEMTVPEGEIPNTVIVDNMHPNLRYYTGAPTVFSITDNAGGDLTYNGTPTVVTSNTGGGQDNVITIDLGTIVNSASNDGDDEIITITYAAEVVEEIDASTITNDATWNYTGGNVNDPADPFTLIRPEVVVTKLVREKPLVGTASFDPADYATSIDRINKSSNLEFLIIVENQSDEADTYGLQIQDIFDAADLENVTLIEARRGDGVVDGGTVLTTGAGNYTGNITTAGGISITGNDIAGTYSVPRITAPQVAGGADSYGPETILLVVEADIVSTVELNQTFQNTARATYFLSDGCTPATCVQLNDEGSANINVEGIPAFTKEISSRPNGYTGDEKINLLEEIEYRIRFSIPEGIANAVIVSDTLDVGLEYITGSAVFSAVDDNAVDLIGSGEILVSGTPVTAGNNPSNQGVVSGMDLRTLLTFNYGSVTNTDSDEAVEEFVDITYRVRVEDVASNIEGTELNNVAELTYDNPNPPPGVFSVTATSDSVIIIKPALEVEKKIIATDNTTSTIDATGNLDDADGSDLVTFQVLIRNIDTESRAYDFVVSDVLPTGLNSPTVTAIEIGNGITYTNISAGAPFTNFFGTANTSDLFTAGGLRSLSDFSVYLEPNGGANLNELRITYTAQVSPTVPQPISLTNQVEVTFSSGPGANPETPITDDATISGISPTTFNKTILDIAPQVVGAGTVQNGEIITYQVSIDIPEGRLENFQIADALDSNEDGLIFLTLKEIRVEGVATTLTTSIGSNDVADIVPTISNSNGNANPEQKRDRLNFDFGNLTNSDNDLDIETLVIEYYATISEANEVRLGRRDRFQNRATYTFNNPSGGSISANVQSPLLSLTEPGITIDKQFGVLTAAPGDEDIPVTLTVRATRGVAFDIRISDVFPSGMSFDAAPVANPVFNVASAPGVTATASTGNTEGSPNVLFTIDRLEQGEEIIISFNVKVASNVVCGGLDNTANVTWTSLPGTFSDLRTSFTPAIPDLAAYPSCLGERTGTAGCRPNYNAGDTETLNIDPGGAVDLTITASDVNPICTDPANNVTLSVNTLASGTTYQWQKEDPVNSGIYVNITSANTPNASGENTEALTLSGISTTEERRYRLQASQAGCLSLTSTPYLLDIIETPQVAIVNNITAPNCTGGVNLTANITNAEAGETYEYIWTYPDPAGGGAPDITTVPTNSDDLILATAISGNYTIVARSIRNNTCDVTLTENIQVSDPIATPILNGGAALIEVCEGDRITLTSGTYAGSSVTYQWRRNGTIIASAPNNNQLVIDPAATGDAGDYSLNVVVDGCTSPISTEVEVRVISTPTVPILTAPGICDGDNLVLTVTNAGSYAAGTTFAWTGPGITGTANGASITIFGATTAASGTYTATVTSPGGGGCSNSATIGATVTAQPTLTPIVGDVNLCDGSILDLTTATIAGGTYTWTQPDGSTVVTTNPRLTKTVTDNDPADEGAYSVVVVVGGCISDPVSTNVIISPAPGAPAILPAAGAICEGETLSLSTSTVATSYQWTGPNGFTSTAQNPTVTTDFQNVHAGTYTLDVTTGSCTATNTVAFTFAAKPSKPVLTFGDNDICDNEAISLIANPTGFTQYTWTSPNGATINTVTNTTSVAVGDPAYAAGDWTVTVTNGSGCTEVSDPVTLTITPVPTATPASNSPAAGVCPGDNVQLIGNTVAGATYRWYQDDGDNTLEVGTDDPLVAITQNHTVTNFSADTRYFLVIDVNGCTDNASINITINNAAAPPVFAPGNVTICEGEILTFSAPVAAVSYSWSGPGGFSSTEANPLVTNSVAQVPHAGTYTVTAFSNCGSRSATFDVIVNPKPTKPVISAVPSTVCTGANFDLNSSVVLGVNEEYRWIDPTGAVTTNTTSPFTITGATAANGGEWRVQIANTTTGCVSDISDPITVTVIPLTPSLPTASPTVCQGDDVVLTANEATGAIYRWYQDDGDGVQELGTDDVIVGTSRNASVPNLAAGNYKFWLDLNVSGCADVSDVDVVVSARPTISDIRNPITLDCTVGNDDLRLNQSLANNANPFTVTGGTGSYNYVWSGPNGFSSVQEQPTIPTANSADQGTYTVYVEDANGCRSDAVSIVVDITDAIETPVINFAGRLCEGEEMELRVDPPYSGAVVSYEWFRNGTAFTTTAIPSYIVPTVALADAGNYSVQVTVDGCVSLISAQTNVEIIPNPTDPTLTVTYNTGTTFDCPGGTVQLTNPETADSYLWVGPNGYTSTEQSPTITNAGLEYNGTYSVTLTNGGQCSVTETIDMNFIKPQPVTPTITGPTQVCEGDRVEFNVPAYTGASVTYTWTLPDASITTTTVPQYVIASADPTNATHLGNFQVAVTVDGCTSLISAPSNLAIQPAITAAPTLNGASVTTVCEGGIIQLIANNYPAAEKYIWRGPNGFSFESLVNSSVVIANATLADAGTYELEVEINGCSSPAVSQAVVVNTTPAKPSLDVNALSLCSDQNLVLTAAPTGANQYIFIKPNGGTIDNGNVNTITITAGTANYIPGEWKVQIVDANACSSPISDPVDITINQKPSALALNDGPICLGSDANLLGNPISGATYEWFFDADNDGMFDDPTLPTPPNPADVLISTGQNHTVNSSDLSTAGTYRYFLRVTKDGCVSDVAETVVTVTSSTIFPEIRANGTSITGDPSPTITTIEVCEGEQVILSSPTASTNYIWNGPDGFSSTLQSPASFIANPASAGNYTLEIVSAGCPTNQQIVELQVNPKPSKPVISATSLNVCDEATAEINLSATAVAGVDYIWIQPNGIEHNPAGTANTLDIPSGDPRYLSGEWRVRLENTTTNCTSEISDPITIDINPLPTAVPTSGGDVCSGDVVQLFGNTVSGASYRWYQEDGTNAAALNIGQDALISTNQNPIVSALAASATAYRFWLVIEANGCDATAVSVDVTVNTPPVVNANAVAATCLSGTTSYSGLTATPAAAGTYTYQWTGPNGYTSSAQNPVIPNATAANSGAYTVVMTDAVTGCQSNAVTVNASITNLPATPAITVSANSLCEGEPLTLSTTAYAGGVVSYEWFRGAASISTTTIPSFTIATAAVANQGDYSVTATVDGCTSARSGEVNVQVDAAPASPTPLVLNPTTNICEGNTPLVIELPAGYHQPGYTYQWIGPNGFTATTQNASIQPVTVQNNGTYSVTVSNGSCGLSATASITVNTILPIPPVPALSTDPFICEGEVLELRTDAFTSATTQYHWFKDGVEMIAEGSPTTNPSFVVTTNAQTPTNNGAYSVEISAGGCTSQRSLTQQVVVSAQPGTPALSFTYTGNCAGQTVGLQSSGDPTFDYFWTGPNGFVSTQQNPTIPNATAASNGTYVVTVRNGTCTNTASIIFSEIIDITPFSPAVIPPNPVCVGDRTVITATNYAGAGSVVTYNWTLPDGSTFTSGSNQLVVDPVTLASGGNYTVQVDVDGCSLPTSLPERLRVNAFPATPTPTSNGPVCEGGTIRLFAGAPTAGGPFTYEWTGPRNFFSNLENPTIDLVTPDYEGTYILTLSGPGGCSVTSTVQVSVGELIAPPTIAGDERYCVGDRLELTATTYPGDAIYTWTLPDGTNQVTTVGQLVVESVTAANSGDYTVRVKVSECETGTSFAKRVIVDNVGSVEATSNTGICEGETLQLTATPVNTTASYNYNWVGPNGFTSTLQNPTINGATSQNSGVYVVSMSTTGSGCIQTAEVNVSIDAKPDTPFLISNQAIICEGDPIILSTGSQGATYQWIGPDGTIDPNDAVLTTTTGTTTIPSTHPSYRSGVWRVRVIGTGGCESEFSQPIDVEIADRPVAIISNNRTICEGEEVEISGNEFEGASYSWYDDNNGARGQLISTGRTLGLGVLPSGSYTYYLIVSVNGCTSEIATAQVNVVGAGLVPTPTAGNPSVCGGNDIQLFANMDADFYNWSGPNGFTSGERNPIIPNATPSDAGRYALTVTQNNCTSSPGTVVVDVTDGAQAVAINPITAVCEGERLVINSAGLAGSGITYLWTKPDGSQQTTSGPSLIIENAKTTDAGAYYVTVNNSGCVSAPSAPVFATVNAKPTLPAISITAQVCEGDAIVLSTPVNADNYLWTGPNGFTSTLKNPPVIQNVNEFNAGEYTLWVETNGCRSEINSAQVTVTEKPVTPQIFSNSPVCNSGVLELYTTRVSANERYTWYLPDGTTRVTQDTFLIVQPFTSVKAGEYKVSRTVNGCNSDPSVGLNAQLVESLADETAFAGDDLFVCDLSESITLNAASTQNGVWKALDGGSLATPTNTSTVVTGLSPEGTYRFVWTIDNRPCGDLSSDTVTVQPAGNPVAEADFEETTVEGFEFKQILMNDIIPQGNEVTVEIIRSPVNGTLTLQPDFTVNYKPVPGYFGEDSFIYEVCLVDCPSNCDTAVVDILITGELEIPDIITPNGDGNNDTFVIRGIENYPENELLIFNRWGNKVFEVINYENDWRGTWRNNELPDGTYYYVFTNRQNGQLISKGFITLHR